jgi:hypothetical protein
VAVVHAVVDADGPEDAIVPGGPAAGFDLITATCAIRVMANPPAHYATSPNHEAGAAVAEMKHEAVTRRY